MASFSYEEAFTPQRTGSQSSFSYDEAMTPVQKKPSLAERDAIEQKRMAQETSPLDVLTVSAGRGLDKLAMGLKQGVLGGAGVLSELLPNQLKTQAQDYLGRELLATENDQKQYDQAYKPLATERPVLTAVGESLPMLATPMLRPLTGAGVIPQAVNAGVTAAAPALLEYGTAEDKAKNAGIAFGAGGLLSSAIGIGAKVLDPSKSGAAAKLAPDVNLLRSEGVRPTVAQEMGGFANNLEERAMSLPFLGNAIAAARKGADDQFRQAAINRAADPIGATVQQGGRDAIGKLGVELGDAYEKVLPKLKVDVLDPNFVGKVSSLRSMVQSLPQAQRDMFDNIIAREVDGRVAPNGVLSGQNLKDAWNALRDEASLFSKSDDAFQAKLGQALKQTFQELKNHVTTTNAPQDVLALKNADFGYANYKRLQKAASALGAESGNFSPAQLQNAVKAADRSKDKASFARGDALMQDLSEAGKNVLTTKYPDSGTAGRSSFNWLAGAAAFPLAAGYLPQSQNALRALLWQRPDLARQLGRNANELAPRLGAFGGMMTID